MGKVKAASPELLKHPVAVEKVTELVLASAITTTL
jgi:hypothetical protein